MITIKQKRALALGRKKGLLKNRPKGLKYRLVKKNPTSFEKGRTPWNKGKKGSHFSRATEIKKGQHLSKSTELTREKVLGEKNYKWKGDLVGYFALHTWVYRKLGKAKKCNKCGSTHNVHWSNISGKYLRKINDWKELCQFCHFSKDRKELREHKRKRIVDVFIGRAY